MIRILFGSTLTVLGLGAATALIGPDLVTGPRGEPLTVAGQRTASFQPANFEGADCGALPTITAERPFTDAAESIGAHVLALAVRQGADGVTLAITDDVSEAEAHVLLAFDDAGRVVAVGAVPPLRERMGREERGCLDAINTPEHSGI